MKLQLESGQEIGLTLLEQSRTYEGLLEGLPVRRGNDAMILRLQEQTVKRFGTAHLVEPTQTPIDEDDYPFGEPAILPSVTCTSLWRGRLDDPTLTSTLAILWWQDDWAGTRRPPRRQETSSVSRFW